MSLCWDPVLVDPVTGLTHPWMVSHNEAFVVCTPSHLASACVWLCDVIIGLVGSLAELASVFD